MDEFTREIGLDNLVGIHLNDSKTEFESRKDRHETIGNGTMGMEPFRLLMNDHRMDDIPIVLETPDPSRWAEEIETLYALVE
jgi:deoxyribonuclease-4